MKLIVGLGNPGIEYDRTRHNAGFMAVDRLADRHAQGVAPRGRFSALTLDAQIGPEKCLLVKPTTYMNRSGQSVAEAVRFFKLDPSADLLVITDDVALPTGAIRLRAGGGAGGHNGLVDIERLLATDSYARCRIGIDSSGLIPMHDYVLGRFSPAQLEAVGPAIERAAQAAEVWASFGITTAMNRFNVRAPAKGADEQPGPSGSDGGPR